MYIFYILLANISTCETTISVLIYCCSVLIGVDGELNLHHWGPPEPWPPCAALGCRCKGTTWSSLRPTPPCRVSGRGAKLRLLLIMFYHAMRCSHSLPGCLHAYFAVVSSVLHSQNQLRSIRRQQVPVLSLIPLLSVQDLDEKINTLVLNSLKFTF